ncbi:hypothetical protein [Zoogloea sp.]|uniref:hypothetical protein n=1 Tax=Zoogloea sp. TaxID=49181 RepID=UPI002607C31C|nr:hypothetical protein [Zoogloea sp.]
MKAVIDTNVLLVANQSHKDISPDCVEECVRRLTMIMADGVTVIDDDFHIISEYLHKTHPNQPKGVGDVFLKWLLRNQSNRRHVEQVSITEISENHFQEFPDPTLEAIFDAPDRKFAAVAHAHPERPPVWQAADCKWMDWWPALKEKELSVEFLCKADARKFYQKKFPEKPLPPFPD